ncbi:MAG: LysR substrate-binding domain-containing protein [Rhodospirillales bacterium]
MAYKLPPLSALRLFEAAGRHLSFKAAAAELNLTPSAVSHGIQTLEDWLGAPLFHRGARGLALTPAGAAYLPEVAAALARLAQATAAVPGRKATGVLSISVAPTFASRWLVPRLAGFTALYPDIAVTIDTERRQVELPVAGCDLAIRIGAGRRGAGTWARLVRESLMPVCAPGAMERHGPALLDGGLLPLIHVTTVSEEWAAWYARAGRAPPALDGGLRFDTVHLALEAAAQGLGIALGRVPLVDGDLDGGRLVALGPAVPGSLSYWLVGAEAAFERPEIRLFRRWLLDAARDGAAGEGGIDDGP